MSSLLRKEFIKDKKQKETVVSKAAISWLSENVIVINEKLDRKSVTRLIDSIQKFEDTFGPYKDKIPSIGAHLDAAERGLELIITGKTNSKKTSNNLKQLSYLYSTLSNFFTRDLPILLKTKMFKVAKEQPEQPISSLPSMNQDGIKHDTAIIHDALANAMAPSKEEKKLLGKIYRATKLPKLEIGKIATELLSLSFDDLEELTKIGKVPMATTPAEPVGKETPGDETAATSGEEGEVSPTEEVAAEAVLRSGGVLSEHLLSENMLTEVGMKEVGNVLQQAYQIVNATGLTSLSEPLNDLHSQVIKYLGSSAGEKAEKHLAQVTDKKTGLLDLFKTPGGNLLKQANMAIETLKALGKIWPDIKDALEKPDFTEADMESVKKNLTQQLQGGFFKKAGAMFKTKPFPGLEPEKIVNALTLGETIARRKIELLERKLNEAPPVNGFDKTLPNAVATNPDGPAVSPPDTTKPVNAVKDMAAARATNVTSPKNMEKSVANLKKTMGALYNFARGNMQNQTNPTTPQPVDSGPAQNKNGTLGSGPGVPNVNPASQARIPQYVHPGTGDANRTQTTNPIAPPTVATPPLGKEIPPAGKKGKQTSADPSPSVDFPDLGKKAGELGISADQLEKVLKWVGVKVNR